MFSRTRRLGFTLIELLVVIAIIAILASILFPVFAKAREKARQTSCLSNLKQLNLAFMQYAQDYDETFPCGVWYGGSSWTLEYAWDYSVDWGAAPVNGFQPSSLGLIGPYTKNTQLGLCPSAKTLQSWGRPYSGYAVNASYICPDGRSGASLGAVQRPSEVVLMADSAYYFGGAPCQNNYLRSPADPMHISGGCLFGLHYRHNGVANVAYCDGHAKAATKKYNASASWPDCGDLSSDDSAYNLQ